MTPPREIVVHPGDDYLLSAHDGELFLWPSSGDLVPANEAARRRVRRDPEPHAHAGAPDTGGCATVFLVRADVELAVVASHPALTPGEEALALAVLRRALPSAIPVLCSPGPNGYREARTAPHAGQGLAGGHQVAAGVAGVNAGRAWDETPVMRIEVDGVLYAVTMLGCSSDCYRTEVARVG